MIVDNDRRIPAAGIRPRSERQEGQPCQTRIQNGLRADRTSDTALENHARLGPDVLVWSLKVGNVKTLTVPLVNVSNCRISSILATPRRSEMVVSVRYELFCHVDQ